jgi:hypothetical protein
MVPRWLSRCLLEQLVDAFVPPGEPVVIGDDDSIERRWGGMIKARSIYRDPVRSSRSHVVKASGLRWLSFMLLPEIPWAGRCWALPFLALLAPSQRFWDTHKKHKRKYKKLTDWARQGLIQTALWLPGRRIIAVCSRTCGRGSAWSPACGSTPRCTIHHPGASLANAGARAWSADVSPASSSASPTRRHAGTACW